MPTSSFNKKFKVTDPNAIDAIKYQLTGIRAIKRPRLLYWEDTEDCYCVANEKDFPGLVSALVKRGARKSTLNFYYQDYPSKVNVLVYDVGNTTLSTVDDCLENYIDVDSLEEGEDIELAVKIQYMTDEEYDALPEI